MKKLMYVAVLVVGFAGCYTDNREELYPAPAGCDTTNVTYSNTLKAIVDSKCATAGCHQGPAPSGWDLTTYAGLQTIAINGKLLPAIDWTGADHMPKNLPQLDACTLAKFHAWVNNNEPQ